MEKVNSKVSEVRKIDILQLHWANFQLRQNHIWQSLNRLVLAIVTLWSIPFITPSLFDSLNVFILFFPAVSIFLAWTGKRLLNAEYLRITVVSEKFNELTPDEYRPDWNKIKKGQVGKIIFKEICTSFIILSFIDLLLIGAMVFNTMPKPG